MITKPFAPLSGVKLFVIMEGVAAVTGVAQRFGAVAVFR
jgi:hypothetical protein